MSESLQLPSVTDERGRPLDVIEVRGLTVDCIVGVYRRERVAVQPLQLDVALFLDTREAAHAGKLARTVHYGRLEGELRFLLESCRFELLESAAEAVCRYVLAPPTEDSHRAQVHAATVRVTKPQALGGRAIPSLQVHRTADEMHYTAEDKPFGRVDIIQESEGYGIYRLRIRPGGSISTSRPPDDGGERAGARRGPAAARQARGARHGLPVASRLRAPLRQPEPRRADRPLRGPSPLHPLG